MQGTLTRDIELEIAHNVRHMGGYKTNHGRTTRPDIIRGASLHRLTDAGLDALAATGVRTIIDLRSSAELHEQATPDLVRHGISFIHAPVFEKDASPVGLGQEFPGYAKVYRSFLRSGKDAYRVLFEVVSESEGGVLFHCAAGKDRTGVAAALLLAVAGVPGDTIVADYAISAVNLAPALEQWLPQMKERGIDIERARELMASPAEDMIGTLAHISETWGSAEAYLLDIGVAPSVVGAVRERMLV